MKGLRDVLVPCSLVQDAQSFGGQRDGDCQRGDLILDENRARHLVASEPTSSPRIVTPALVEAHCHLDKCHTIARLGAVGGDLSAAISAQMADKDQWTELDLRHRMTQGIAELRAAGCGALRSHIDWGNAASPPLAWSVLNDLAQDTADLTLQPAALTGIDQLADRSFCNAVASHVADTPNGVLGAFVLHHGTADIQNGLRNVFAAADRLGLALDFHVDEGLGAFNGLEAICDAALDVGFVGPVLCGHAVSLVDKDTETLDRIIDKLIRSGIHVCALPTTNLYLQGRRSGTPDRRGITRLRELHAAGVPILVGSDNVGDAFCPMGQHDPRAALHLASLGAHLDPPMGDWLPLITQHASTALGLNPICVDGARLADLRICPAPTTADFVAHRHPLLPVPNNEELATS